MFVTQRNYIIFYVQSTPFIKECWKFCTSYQHNFSKYFAHSINTIITQRNYIITYVWSMQFFKERSIFCTFNVHNFSEINCTFKEHCDLNNLHNFLSANYAIFWITLKISLFQHTHNYSKNLHNFVRTFKVLSVSKNTQNCTHSTYTIT